MYLFQGKIHFGYGNTTAFNVQEELQMFQLGYRKSKKGLAQNVSDIRTRLNSYYCCYYHLIFVKGVVFSLNLVKSFAEKILMAHLDPLMRKRLPRSIK